MLFPFSQQTKTADVTQRLSLCVCVGRTQPAPRSSCHCRCRGSIRSVVCIAWLHQRAAVAPRHHLHSSLASPLLPKKPSPFCAIRPCHYLSPRQPSCHAVVVVTATATAAIIHHHHQSSPHNPSSTQSLVPNKHMLVSLALKRCTLAATYHNTILTSSWCSCFPSCELFSQCIPPTRAPCASRCPPFCIVIVISTSHGCVCFCRCVHACSVISIIRLSVSIPQSLSITTTTTSNDAMRMCCCNGVSAPSIVKQPSHCRDATCCRCCW